MSRYLVTGATGFLGGHLTRNLLEQGHEVTALCRGPNAELIGLGAAVVATVSTADFSPPPPLHPATTDSAAVNAAAHLLMWS